MNLQWENKVPTKPGFYWKRYDEHDNEPEVVRIARIYSGELVEFGLDTKFTLDAESQWAGPIPEPEGKP